ATKIPIALHCIVSRSPRPAEPSFARNISILRKRKQLAGALRPARPWAKRPAAALVGKGLAGKSPGCRPQRRPARRRPFPASASVAAAANRPAAARSEMRRRAPPPVARADRDERYAPARERPRPAIRLLTTRSNPEARARRAATS